jgi:hypothetical protein
MDFKFKGAFPKPEGIWREPKFFPACKIKIAAGRPLFRFQKVTIHPPIKKEKEPVLSTPYQGRIKKPIHPDGFPEDKGRVDSVV